MTQRTVLIAADTLERLTPHAARRRISVPELVRRIVDAAADDNLVDGILDDAGSHPKPQRELGDSP